MCPKYQAASGTYVSGSLRPIPRREKSVSMLWTWRESRAAAPEPTAPQNVTAAAARRHQVSAPATRAKWPSSLMLPDARPKKIAANALLAISKSWALVSATLYQSIIRS